MLPTPKIKADEEFKIAFEQFKERTWRVLHPLFVNTVETIDS
jgi:hypothetical protein